MRCHGCLKFRDNVSRTRLLFVCTLVQRAILWALPLLFALGTNAASVGCSTEKRSPSMTNQIDTNLGELITVFYEEYLAMYGDEDLASVAAAATINELLLQGSEAVAEQAA